MDVGVHLARTRGRRLLRHSGRRKGSLSSFVERSTLGNEDVSGASIRVVCRLHGVKTGVGRLTGRVGALPSSRGVLCSLSQVGRCLSSMRAVGQGLL